MGNGMAVSREDNMESTSVGNEPVSAARIHGFASGVFLVTIFSTAWAMVGIGALNGIGQPWLEIIAVVVGLLLVAGGTKLIRSSRQLPGAPSEKADKQHRERTRWFRATFVTEIALILSALVILRALNRVDLFFPAIVLIVGLHFFPLGYLFQIRAHYITALSLCALALITFLVVPEHVGLAGQPIAAWQVIIGFGAALVLWGDGFALWQRARSLVSVAQNSS
jgi:hypothetical protein